MSETQPRIAVSYAVNSPSASARYSRILSVLANNTEKSLTALGAQVQIIDTVSRALSPREVIEHHDGLLVLGGADICPSLYGQQPESDAVYALNREADTYEVSLINAAQAAGTPVLGICRGMQLINVAAGGTLIQDLPGPNQHKDPDTTAENRFADHDVSLIPETLLAEAYSGRAVLPIRSSHHQAVDEVGAGLKVNARSDDQVIEGLERETPWALGVQWHPEETRAEQEQFDRLLTAFLQRCTPGRVEP